ncbi:MAG: 16S rRNA (adenine(1518)-N(6)/adenine(1519)-N(6))-dimethyltransferase RsmA [Leptolyngbyaceae cyanobacterium SL_1_1]|nr:16S rRNA (adenine(1518)-N(6)/adenine(1519)-N(6))-dimethyltransferase RsmA [Leptolyngbyaceae cyanobacterium RM2_2_21]NJN01057.1 16S rRNA (adenine(1518)-N(6)/adenine(1519)-N(6))-dimethyltransferase RsmA [Leptolyngbyaceae cyanobacterium RM1_1_2]NJO11944.1 16S rRNA (adenine(1518)-N(6)/adenine(1519)-N(6))-dimethyltransferase RsmA [Leptolyngbyaceae cyanobacterium SL_1_1]
MPPQTRKRFGQHWLKSEKVLHRILEAAEVSKRDRILEIGPGTGVLTQWLAALADAVVAVEIDRDLCKRLRSQFEKLDQFLLLEGDILRLDLADELADYPGFQPNKVVANIPYYITAPILEKLLGSITQPNPQPFEQIVLLIQREVADRLYAQPGSKVFGALSVRMQYLACCELICPVSAKAFQPPPKVESAVVRLRPRPFFPVALNPRLFDYLVQLGFSSRRKMLRNNLKAVVNREQLTSLLDSLDALPTIRAEDLSVEQWVRLSNKIQEAGADSYN